MPDESEFTSSREFRAGAYCIPGFFDNSPVKLRLIHVESPPQKKFTSEKVTFRFSPSTFARCPYSLFPPLWLTSTFRCFPSSRVLSSVKPTLPYPYLNSRSTLSQVRSAHSRSSLCRRRFIASFNNVLFFFLFFSDESEVECAPFPPFRR